MTYTVLRKKNTAKVICCLLFLLILVLGVLSALELGIVPLWHMLIFLALVAVTQVSKHFVLEGYEYILDPSEGLLVRNRLTVIKMIGKRRFPMMTLDLKNLTDAVRYKKPKEIREKFGRLSERYDFCADVFPSESYMLIFENDGELTGIRLQCGDELASELKNRAGV